MLNTSNHKPPSHLCYFIAQEAPKPDVPQTEEIDVSQVIGMVIALVAIIYTLGSSFFEIFRKKKPEPHVAIEKEKKNILDEFLKSMETEVEDEGEEEEREMQLREEARSHKPPSPPRVDQGAYEPVKQKSGSRGWPRPENKFVFHTNIEDYKPKTSIDERKLEIKLHSGDDLISDDLKVWGPGTAQAVQRKEAPIHQLLKGLSTKKALIFSHQLAFENLISFHSSVDSRSFKKCARAHKNRSSLIWQKT